MSRILSSSICNKSPKFCPVSALLTQPRARTTRVVCCGGPGRARPAAAARVAGVRGASRGFLSSTFVYHVHQFDGDTRCTRTLDLPACFGTHFILTLRSTAIFIFPRHVKSINFVSRVNLDSCQKAVTTVKRIFQDVIWTTLFMTRYESIKVQTKQIDIILFGCKRYRIK